MSLEKNYVQSSSPAVLADIKDCFSKIKNMNRENIRRKLSAILMDTKEKHPLDCNILIGQDEALLDCNILIGQDEVFGLSTLQMPKIIKLFQQPSEGIIWAVIEGYEQPVEFDDLTDDDVKNIAIYFGI